MDKLKGVQYRRVVSGHSEPSLKSVGHMTYWRFTFGKIHGKMCEMKMDKLQGVQYRKVVSGQSEPSLKSLGDMTKELLKF